MSYYYAVCALCGRTIQWEQGKQPADVEVIKRRGYPTMRIHTKCIEKERRQNGHDKS